ncbi:TetR/AcrR family transcriptional regulator [Thermocatellispora tengchongensis]|uniref:TetR/AcrR family transcriptional regulator n=1 Tax=Thermocatellispora tengchongensis TaxID=1073253 RepID=UPI0036254875
MRTDSRPTGRTFVEEARRRQIIDAAIVTVAERGYANASLAQIAATAGISKSVISYHFAGKEELLREVVTQVYAECGEAVEAALGACDTWSDRLAAFITAELDYMRHNRHKWLAASEIVISHRDESGTPLYLKARDETQGFEWVLEEGRRAGSSATTSTCASRP